MTPRQRILKLVYPLLIWARQRRGSKAHLQNRQGVVPPVSFYALSAVLNSGETLPFATLKGKKVLLVNTASDCGYTAQYAELQTLHRHAKEMLVILAFPSNDFKKQEKGSDAAIARFCSAHYGVRFPLVQKSVVLKNGQQHPVYRWLTRPELNGWNHQPPAWNFAKYLVNEEGILTHYFDPAVSPVSDAVRQAIEA